MSVSFALQALVFEQLMADAGVRALVGDRIYDGVPQMAELPYLSFGPSDYEPDDAVEIDAREETLQVDCWTRLPIHQARALADAVKTALHRYGGELSSGALVSLEVERVRVIDDPDEITAHGVVTLRALIEEGA